MKTQNFKVSVGLPVYNGELFLEACLDSLLSQTYSDFELIISDNASTDGTEAICQAYAAKDQRIRYARNATNVGVGPNFNRAFRLSTGDYFKWASADDFCKPDLLARCLEVLDHDQGAVLVYPKTHFIDATGKILNIHDPGWDLRSEAASDRLYHVICAGHWVNSHYGLIRSNALAKTRLIPSYPGGDYRLLAELSLQGKFVEIPEYLFLRRIHSGASSQNTTDLNWTTAFFGGSQKDVCFPFWNLNIDYLITVMNSDLGANDKLSLVGLVLRRMWWKHEQLLRELKVGFTAYRKRLKA
jgi:glycosyltransferase involved in cell wall biosynthesis